MKTLLLPILIVVVGADACRSASSHYYTLVAPGDDAPAPVSNELQVDVLPVDVPPDVDRAEIVVREGPGEVTPVDTRAWIAPLSHELRRAFSDDLTRALGARDIAGLTPTAGVPTYRVKLAVQRFESVIGDHALIEAVSTVREASGSAPALVCSHRARHAAKADYSGIAEAHQQALVEIAKQIADEVRAAAGGHPACASAPAAKS